MSAHRIVFLLLVIVIVWPLAEPLISLILHPAAWQAWTESDRLVALVGASAALVAGSVSIAVPLGVVVAIILERGRPAGAASLRVLVVLGLFIPLPVYATAWQSVLTALGNSTTDRDPVGGGWRPWREGLPPAILVHAMAGLPWVVVIVGLALRTTDRRLEDEARLTGGEGAVIRWVLVPRLAGATLAAAACVAVQAWTTIAVTDTAIVRTFAEEVYAQIVGSPAGVASAVAVIVPVWIVASGVGSFLAYRLAYAIPTTGELLPGRPLRIPIWLRAGLSISLAVGAIVWVGLPLAALVEKASGASPNAAALLGRLGLVTQAHGAMLADSLVWSAVAALATALLAWQACDLAMRSRVLAAFVFSLAAVAWVTPGPILGFGLKRAIDHLLTIEEIGLDLLGLTPAFPPFQSLLYDQPSPVPAIWAAVVRFFPVAVAVLWPAFRRMPRELRDLARLEGGPRWQRRAVVWPATRSAFVLATVTTMVLALGEVEAGKLVQPPGRQSFVQELFNAMHYGPDATVAALAILQVFATVVVVGVFLLLCQSGWIRARRSGARNG